MISSRRCLETPHQLGSSPTLILNLPPWSWSLRALPARTSSFQARNQNAPHLLLVLPFTRPRRAHSRALLVPLTKAGTYPKRWPYPPASCPQKPPLLLCYLFALLPLLLLPLEVLLPLQTLAFRFFSGPSFGFLFLPKSPETFKQLNPSLPSGPTLGPPAGGPGAQPARTTPPCPGTCFCSRSCSSCSACAFSRASCSSRLRASASLSARASASRASCSSRILLGDGKLGLSPVLLQQLPHGPRPTLSGTEGALTCLFLPVAFAPVPHAPAVPGPGAASQPGAE